MEAELLELRLEFRQGAYGPISALCRGYEVDSIVQSHSTKCRGYSLDGCSNPHISNENNPSCAIMDLRKKLNPLRD